MNLPRRSFLAQAAAAAAGLSLPGCQDKGSEETRVPPPAAPPPIPDKPKALIDALARSRAENKPCILVRVPEDKHLRHEPGHTLVHLLNLDSPDSRELLSEAVLVCLESPIVRHYVRSAPPHQDLVLVDEEGRAVDGRPFDYKKAWTTLPEALRALAHGAAGSRLRERAETIRARTDPGVLQALDRLGTGAAKSEEDQALLLGEAPRIMALLVQARLEARSSVRQKAFRDLIDGYYRSCPPASAGPRLPYGIDTIPFQGGCGDDPCREQAPPEGDLVCVISCGMGRVPPDTRSFLKYLTQ